MIHPSLRRKRAKPIERRSRPRKLRKGGVAKDKRECDRLFSLIVRAPGSCQRCNAATNLQCAHGFSRRYLGTRWDERNAWCLCGGCHYKYTLDPLGWDDWMQSRLGPDLYRELRTKALQPTRFDPVILVALRLRAEEMGVA